MVSVLTNELISIQNVRDVGIRERLRHGCNRVDKSVACIDTNSLLGLSKDRDIGHGEVHPLQRFRGRRHEAIGNHDVERYVNQGIEQIRVEAFEHGAQKHHLFFLELLDLKCRTAITLRAGNH